ncbi:DUF4044 domain-containing protein [Vagococcus fluvialis]|jgi:hypothetical protein|uniref:DUF4044 domain-containing protein n=1 Tax=Vagococcus fluvialis TaxID=2738 RepID=A0A369AXE7_9ENTE|nr:DUF4044 domain-containing protein [Vagococcus fluvialis]MDR2278541.1 DUF4044 domain-containing protein [Vagococcus sp.]OTP33945.1 hypothetical protein A5798_000677 [Enterococcus sp. 6C8_DIV0013]MBO0419637.1 DUF4044 domain-containing protein [Vagococcus fluvialis]MBO0429674.1 DUF4044 domain-containing protein [Vagococcus fluvialis]MBO0437783.1 DUF4044 domain-containing protein [Vagococcus fluvialis]
MDKKEKSTFSKVTKVVIWVMLLAMVGGTVLGALASLGVI